MGEVLIRTDKLVVNGVMQYPFEQIKYDQRSNPMSASFKQNSGYISINMNNTSATVEQAPNNDFAGTALVPSAPFVLSPNISNAEITIEYSAVGSLVASPSRAFFLSVGCSASNEYALQSFGSIMLGWLPPGEINYQRTVAKFKNSQGIPEVIQKRWLYFGPLFNAHTSSHGGYHIKRYDITLNVYNMSIDWYAPNAAPTTPTNITTTGNQAGKPAATTVTPSTDADGDPISYVWEQRSDTGAYAQIGITTNPTITYNVPTAGKTFTRRCKAVDDQGGESTYVTGADMLIDYNLPPTITDTDRDLGTFAESPPAWTGSATDPEGKALTAVIRLDNEVLQTQSGTGAISLSLAAIDHDKWIRIPNGNHTITIAATDDKSAQAVRKLTFAKRENQFEFYRGQSTHQRPSKALISVSPNKSTWADGTVQLWVTNNGNDAEADIRWVQVPLASIGDSANAALAVDLLNEVKVAENWCLALHMKAVEGMSGAALTTDMLTINVSIELVVPPTP